MDKFGIVLSIIALSLIGCNRQERNIITDKAPFYSTELPYKTNDEEAVISAVRRFADIHEMDFLLARRTLQRGDFNASANSSSINLKAMHISATAQGLQVYAISRDTPGKNDKMLLKQFLDELKLASRS